MEFQNFQRCTHFLHQKPDLKIEMLIITTFLQMCVCVVYILVRFLLNNLKPDHYLLDEYKRKYDVFGENNPWRGENWDVERLEEMYG